MLFSQSQIFANPLLSSEGRPLSSVGFVVDSLSTLTLDQERQAYVKVQDETVCLVDGVLDDNWHVTMVQRNPLLPELERATANIRLLHALGIGQVISFNHMGEHKPGDIVLCIDSASSTCPRLVSDFRQNVLVRDLAVVVAGKATVLDFGEASIESAQACEFGLCFVSLCSLGEAFNRWATGALVRQIVASIDEISTCNCRN